MGVSRFLEYLVGGTKVPRKFGMGVSKHLGYLVGGTKIPYSQGGTKYPRLEGCRISQDIWNGGAKFRGMPNILRHG